MSNHILSGQVIGGVKLHEWLEDDGRLSRYSTVDYKYGDSVWICNDCDQLEEDCCCDDEYDGQPDELTEWMDFDPDC